VRPHAREQPARARGRKERCPRSQTATRTLLDVTRVSPVRFRSSEDHSFELNRACRRTNLRVQFGCSASRM
jgi:hypothetical protein